MKVKRYLDNDKALSAYKSLLEINYKDMPAIIGPKLDSLRHNTAADSPFRDHCRWVSIVVYDDGGVTAHANVVVDDRLPDIAHVGYLESVDLFETFSLLMDEVSLVAKEYGAKMVRGPVNFSTWQDFRCVTDFGQYQPIFLEPYNTEHMSIYLERYGFKGVLPYVTTVQNIEDFKSQIEPGVQKEGGRYSYEIVTKDVAGEMVGGLREVAIDAFSGTLSFVDLSLEEFSYMYQLPLSQNDIFNIFVAKDDEKVIGFLVAAFNIFDSERKSYCFKTIAVHSDYRGEGVANALFSKALDNLAGSNVEDCVFVTLQVDNAAIKNVLGEQKVVRKYDVYEYQL